MNEQFKTLFIQAINPKEKLVIKYFSKKDSLNVTRTIAPLDFGPKYKPNSNEFAADGKDFFHFFDFDGSNGGHITSKDPDEVVDFQKTGTFFDPADVVELPKKHQWHIARDWGSYS